MINNNNDELRLFILLSFFQTNWTTHLKSLKAIAKPYHKKTQANRLKSEALTDKFGNNGRKLNDCEPFPVPPHSPV